MPWIKRFAFLGYGLCAVVLPALTGCSPTEPMEKSMRTMSDASITTDAEGRRKIVCESSQGCVWEVTCPDTGTFTMEAQTGGDIEIGPSCEFKPQ